MAKVSEKEMSVRVAASGHQTAQPSETVQQDRRRRKSAQSTAGCENTGFSGLAQVLLTERAQIDQQFTTQAWTIKFRGHTQFIDINEFGVDPAAIDCMPAEVALAFEMLPLRMVGSKLLAAVAEQRSARRRSWATAGQRSAVGLGGR